jgi:hypothetical protein
MSSMRIVRRYCSAVLGSAGLLACLAVPATAQTADPNPGAITISGATDVTNAYMFRGIRQEDESLILWPYYDLGEHRNLEQPAQGAVGQFGFHS